MSHDRRSQQGADEYRSWDAAYVLGTLVPSERHEFESHLSGCAGCKAAVAELAGIPALLAVLSPEEAIALGQSERARPALGVPAGLAKKVQRGRRRVRLAVAGLVMGAAAASGAVTVAVTAPAPPAAQTQAASQKALNFTPVSDSSLAAKGSLTPQPWGTRIDWACTYTAAPVDVPVPTGTAGPGSPEEFGLVVVDSRGVTTQVATWAATPGTVATPTATTVVRLSDIRRVEIRAIPSGRTVLTASV
jgi:RNA polymerase sigma-70 factor (ECF subfamily)